MGSVVDGQEPTIPIAAGSCEDQSVSDPPARVVPAERPGASLATDPRPLQDPGFGGDAPADAGRAGPGLLRSIPAGVSDGPGPGGGPPGARAGILGGAGVLRAGPEPPRGGADHREAARREVPAAPG